MVLPPPTITHLPSEDLQNSEGRRGEREQAALLLGHMALGSYKQCLFVNRRLLGLSQPFGLATK